LILEYVPEILCNVLFQMKLVALNLDPH